jgi:hypothetical protein
VCGFFLVFLSLFFPFPPLSFISVLSLLVPLAVIYRPVRWRVYFHCLFFFSLFEGPLPLLEISSYPPATLPSSLPSVLLAIAHTRRHSLFVVLFLFLFLVVVRS